MEILKAILQQADNAWALLTIPCLVVAASIFVNALPIPTLIVLVLLILSELDKAQQIVGMPGDEAELRRMQFKLRFSAAVLTIGTVLTYGVNIWLHISVGHLCGDYAGNIPGNLPSLLQKFVPHTCP